MALKKIHTIANSIKAMSPQFVLRTNFSVKIIHLLFVLRIYIIAMDMSTSCVLCGKKSQDYAIECPCCGNFYCSDECKARGHQKKVTHYTWLDYKHLYNKIMKSDKNIRLVTICNDSGEILYSGHREDVKNLLDRDESRKSLEMAVKGWKIRNDELAPKIGKVRYVLTEYEKVKRIVIPFGEGLLLYVTTEVSCDDSKLIKTIKALDFS